MSKTRKRVLSVLTILFAIALVFTACFALAGCGDGEEETTWPEEWTEYKFDAKKGDATEDEDGNAYYYWIFSDGTSMFGTQTQYDMLVNQGGTSGSTGFWGYEDGTLTFVKTSTGVDMSSGSMVLYDTYGYCTTTTSGNSVTVTTQDTTPWSATITDIGCLAGKTGYNLSTLEIS